MRKYIRYPIDLPVSIEKEAGDLRGSYALQNCSQGGMSFRSAVSFAPDTLVTVSMPLIASDCVLQGIIRWCIHPRDFYEIGVEFQDTNDFFRIRLIEQVCYIKHYQKERSQSDGQQLSDEQAAREWVAKYAGHFVR